MWKKVRKKPVEVEAFQVTEDFILDYVDNQNIPTLVLGSINCHRGDRVLHSYRLYIETLEGNMDTRVSDWVIKGVKGELYPCKDDIFRLTYDVV